jgi:hypothetical protein
MKQVSILCMFGMLLFLTQAAFAAKSFTVTGAAHFVDIEWNEVTITESGDDFITVERPIRHAYVVVRDLYNNKVLGTSVTDANGKFSFKVKKFPSTGGMFFVEIQSRTAPKKQMQQETWQVFVRDNVGDYPLYAMKSLWQVAVNGGTTAIGTMVANPLTVSGFGSRSYEGSPFNIFDTIIDGFNYWSGTLGAAKKPETSITTYWGGLGFSSASSDTAIFLAGSDAFDDLVILHELGHVVHNVYSNNDSPGGGHQLSDNNQHPALAFAEAWGHAFGCAVNVAGGGAPISYSVLAYTPLVYPYINCETGAPYEQSGWEMGSEAAITTVLYDILDGTTANDGLAGDDDPLTQNTLLGGQPVTKRFRGAFEKLKKDKNVQFPRFWNRWFKEHSQIGDGLYGEFLSVTNARHFALEDDLSEPNDTAAQATAVTPNCSWSDKRSLYRAPAGKAAPGENDQDNYKFAVQVASGQSKVITVETTDAETGLLANISCNSIIDPEILLYSPSGATLGSDKNSGKCRHAKLTVTVNQSGSYRMLVRHQTTEPDDTELLRGVGSYRYRVCVG